MSTTLPKTWYLEQRVAPVSTKCSMYDEVGQPCSPVVVWRPKLPVLPPAGTKAASAPRGTGDRARIDRAPSPATNPFIPMMPATHTMKQAE